MAAVLRFRRADSSEVEAPIADVGSELVLSSVPWRTFRSHRRQSHLSGYYWSSTTGGHVLYESRLELARLLLADADPEVVGIAAQPFLVEADGRRHVPDFFLHRRGAPPLVVNVKPAERLSNPKVADALAWAAEVFRNKAWDHEIWSGVDPQVLANVRFLAGYRRAVLLDPEVLDGARQRLRGRLTLGEAEAVSSPPPDLRRLAGLHHLPRPRWCVPPLVAAHVGLRLPHSRPTPRRDLLRLWSTA